jgi:hypothetical protein
MQVLGSDPFEIVYVSFQVALTDSHFVPFAQAICGLHDSHRYMASEFVDAGRSHLRLWPVCFLFDCFVIPPIGGGTGGRFLQRLCPQVSLQVTETMMRQMIGI